MSRERVHNILFWVSVLGGFLDLVLHSWAKSNPILKPHANIFLLSAFCFTVGAYINHFLARKPRR